MRERPILMSAPMVRATQRDIDPKGQTRRILKPPTWVDDEERAICELREMAKAGKTPGLALFDDGRPICRFVCPYGEPGDRLWVRETWALESLGDDGERIVWAADRAAAWRSEPKEIYFLESLYTPRKWRPSIFMPRWASRITLEVTGIRIERLQDISEEDARAEGLACLSKERGQTYCAAPPPSSTSSRAKYGIADRDGLPGTDDTGWPWHEWDADPRKAFARLWVKINGAESWDANPWVWVVGFRRVTP